MDSVQDVPKPSSVPILVSIFNHRIPTKDHRHSLDEFMVAISDPEATMTSYNQKKGIEGALFEKPVCTEQSRICHGSMFTFFLKGGCPVESVFWPGHFVIDIFRTPYGFIDKIEIRSLITKYFSDSCLRYDHLPRSEWLCDMVILY